MKKEFRKTIRGLALAVVVSAGIVPTGLAQTFNWDGIQQGSPSQPIPRWLSATAAQPPQGVLKQTTGDQLAGKTYLHDLLAPDQCREIREREPLFHCQLMVRFIPGNVVMFRYTDIMNREKYELIGNQIRSYSPESERLMIFTLSDDLQTMTDESGRIFRLSDRQTKK